MKLSASLLCAFLPTMAGCQQTADPVADININTSDKPVEAITLLAKTAQKCWFKSKDGAFKQFKMAAEVNSYAGRPRFLLVPRNAPGNLPSLVVQAEQVDSATGSKFTRIKGFGPLLSSGDGKRIDADIRRWSKGDTACA